MKKVLAALLALTMLFALAVPAFAEEIVVFENAEGQAFADCANSWDFFGTDGYWGREAAQCLSVTWADIKPIMEEGGATFTYVYSGDGAGICRLREDGGRHTGTDSGMQRGKHPSEKITEWLRPEWRAYESVF